jgi:hypothetical protein
MNVILPWSNGSTLSAIKNVPPLINRKLLQTRVAKNLLYRVLSLDWLVVKVAEPEITYILCKFLFFSSAVCITL